jgi:hypothetical protein
VQPGTDEAAATLAVLLRSAAAMDSPGVVWLGENTLPDDVLGALCDILFRLATARLFIGPLLSSGRYFRYHVTIHSWGTVIFHTSLYDVSCSSTNINYRKVVFIY